MRFCRQLPAAAVSGEGESESEGEGDVHTMYFINDGVYGSFNCVLYDHQQVHAEPLEVTALCSMYLRNYPPDLR